MDRKLKLSNKNKIIAGVCGGIGEYFNIDPTVVRLIFILSNFLLWGTPILIYLIFWAVIPKESFVDKTTNHINDNFGKFNDFSEFNEDDNKKI